MRRAGHFWPQLQCADPESIHRFQIERVHRKPESGDLLAVSAQLHDFQSCAFGGGALSQGTPGTLADVATLWGVLAET